MSTIFKFVLFLGGLFLVSACATSMTPIEVNKTLPTLTKAQFLLTFEAGENGHQTGCKYLVKGRSYTAPIGFTVNRDLKNAAKGIDEWVELDGGNAYVLTNYRWVTVDDHGSTQLHVEFDTMLCK